MEVERITCSRAFCFLFFCGCCNSFFCAHRVLHVHHFIQLFGDALHLLRFGHLEPIFSPSVVLLCGEETPRLCKKSSPPNLSLSLPRYFLHFTQSVSGCCCCLPLVCCCVSLGDDGNCSFIFLQIRTWVEIKLYVIFFSSCDLGIFVGQNWTSWFIYNCEYSLCPRESLFLHTARVVIVNQSKLFLLGMNLSRCKGIFEHVWRMRACSKYSWYYK